jgi:hypothetical protein
LAGNHQHLIRAGVWRVRRLKLLTRCFIFGMEHVRDLCVAAVMARSDVAPVNLLLCHQAPGEFAEFGFRGADPYGLRTPP